MEGQGKIAVLIDAENISTKYMKLIMDEVGKYGIATYKRVYGDFSNPGVMAWQDKLREFAMTPIFQFNYTRGKNASDSALIIDAMDILYSGKVTGFCLVTSDSDFTKLAIRLREAGMLVIGMGEQKTPNSLVAACEPFKYLDLLYQENSEENRKLEKMAEDWKEGRKDSGTKGKKQNRGTSESIAEGEEESTVNKIPTKKEVGAEIVSIIESRSEEDEWVNISDIGNILPKRIPGFDPRNYKYEKLGGLIKSYDFLETKAIPNSKDKLLKVVYVRIKQGMKG
ncbi:MAG: NYN domain-containing protein [Lachnospiraceae bacterium]|nr:NYN domain-containing protein [Lachnospiraceae bacterium]